MDLKAELQQLIAEINDDQLLQKLVKELKAAREVQKTTNVFDELKTSRDEVQQLKAQLDKFYSIISFELGSPLNSLRSMADFLLMDAEQAGDPGVIASARFLHNQVEKIQRQMGNLIEWSSMEVKNYVFKPGDFDAGEVIARTVNLFEKQAIDKGVELVAPAAAPVPVKGEARMIQLVLTNLLSNAVKFSRKGDRVEVAVTLREDSAEISVKDTGIGMGKAKMENLLNPGRKNTQRGTANEPGLGLGLITAKALLDLHQVPLKMESEQGKGSVFSFTLPR